MPHPTIVAVGCPTPHPLSARSTAPWACGSATRSAGGDFNAELVKKQEIEMPTCAPDPTIEMLEDLMLLPMARVLVVEDEEDIAFPLVRTLEREGYAVEWVENGSDALHHIKSDAPDMVILDLGLPDVDGLEVCRSARDTGFEGAIMIVTARAGELDRVVGLDYGADDYLAKPFGLAELQARARALLRRTSGSVNGTKAAEEEQPDEDALRIDAAARRVFAGSQEISLTGKEFEVLAILAENRDKVVSRGRLMADVWDENWYGSTKTLDVTIGRLRQKLEGVGVSERVVAVRGVGFRLEGAPDA